MAFAAECSVLEEVRVWPGALAALGIFRSYETYEVMNPEGLNLTKYDPSIVRLYLCYRSLTGIKIVSV